MSPLDLLCWQNGSLFERIVMLRDKLKQIQCLMDKDPHNEKLRQEDLFSEVLSTEEPMEMIKTVCGDEIKNAMYDIDNQKALGLDGLSTNFYKFAWCVIRQDICVAVIDCLDTEGYLDM
ncbi:hypothetical protein Tco_1008419 [Tanacetum coccineum]